MQITMTLSSMAALFGAMIVLAAVPSVSVLAVSARSVSSGFVHGAMTALGVVAGDLIFILLAMFGLALLVEALGDWFVWVKYLGGVYLVWLGVSFLRSSGENTEVRDPRDASRLSSFMTGLLVTLGDQKAVLFYLGFLPAFVDLDGYSYVDVGVVAAIAVVAVGGVKLGYAYAANQAGAVFGAKAARALNVTAACIMIAVGVFVIVLA